VTKKRRDELKRQMQEDLDYCRTEIPDCWRRIENLRDKLKNMRLLREENERQANENPLVPPSAGDTMISAEDTIIIEDSKTEDSKPE
jgi:hypothetical protein